MSDFDDDSSSSDEDVPLASLSKEKQTTNGNSSQSPTRKRAATSYKEDSSDSSSEEQEFQDDIDDNDDDDVQADTDEEDGDSDSSEDVPLAALKQKKATSDPKKKAPTKKASAEKTTKTTTKTTKKKKASNGNKSSSNGSTSGAASSSSSLKTASGILYSSCDKGKLVQSLLCRWWYAITWPDPTSLPTAPPKYYDALDGFPGVYVCTISHETDENGGSGKPVGHILDLRPADTCPNFVNFAKKPSEELKELLLTAIQNQKKALVEAEGSGTQTEKDLATLEKWCRKVNATKADREAQKVCKAAKLNNVLL